MGRNLTGETTVKWLPGPGHGVCDTCGETQQDPERGFAYVRGGTHGFAAQTCRTCLLAIWAFAAADGGSPEERLAALEAEKRRIWADVNAGQIVERGLVLAAIALLGRRPCITGSGQEGHHKEYVRITESGEICQFCGEP